MKTTDQRAAEFRAILERADNAALISEVKAYLQALEAVATTGDLGVDPHQFLQEADGHRNVMSAMGLIDRKLRSELICAALAGQ